MDRNHLKTGRQRRDAKVANTAFVAMGQAGCTAMGASLAEE